MHYLWNIVTDSLSGDKTPDRNYTLFKFDYFDSTWS